MTIGQGDLPAGRLDLFAKTNESAHAGRVEKTNAVQIEDKVTGAVPVDPLGQFLGELAHLVMSQLRQLDLHRDEQPLLFDGESC